MIPNRQGSGHLQEYYWLFILPTCEEELSHTNNHVTLDNHQSLCVERPDFYFPVQIFST